MKRRLFVLCLGCLGACHLAAQAAGRISAADPRHFMQPVGQDWVELWADAQRLRAEALVMSQQPVDSSGNRLIGYYTLARNLSLN